MSRRARRVFGYALVITAFGAGLTYLVLVSHYARTLPGSTRPGSGEIIPMNVHGTVVFLTASQRSILWGLQLGAVILGALGGLFLVWRKS